MARRPVFRLSRPALFLGLAWQLTTMAEAQSPKAFAPPGDRVAWDAQREGLRSKLDEALGRGLPERPKEPRLDVRRKTKSSNFMVESLSIEAAEHVSRAIDGVLVLPESASPSNRVPLVILVQDSARAASNPIDAPGLDEIPSSISLAMFGFASLTIDVGGPGASGVRNLRVVLNAVMSRPEIDTGRVGVVGFGRSGIIALTLMALEPRISCGVSAVETSDFAALENLFDSNLFAQVHRGTFVDQLAALCAPRPLSLLIGEAFPFRSSSPARSLERATKGTYKVYGGEGTGLAMNIYGEFGDHTTISTRLQWMAGLEQLDKHFRPQGPARLGHEPEPEPEVDGRFLDLAEHGIAGWSAEMAQRPETWNWSDGLIVCKPGPGEFGWLRAPIEVEDFILRVEWRVPDKGNGGIFLRARPVTWALPPGDFSRPRLQALGLDWPSRTGLELQAQADPGEANRYSSGSLYRHAAPAANPTNPPGQWNRYTVRARGPRVEVWSNGRQVLDTSIDRYPETLPNPPGKGYIGLQNHGSPGAYRNVKLLPLRN